MLWFLSAAEQLWKNKIKLQQTTILYFLYSFNRMDDVWGGGAETFNEKLLKGWKILHYNYLFLCVFFETEWLNLIYIHFKMFSSLRAETDLYSHCEDAFIPLC